MATRFQSFRHSVEATLRAGLERNLATAAMEWSSEIPRVMSGPKSGLVYRVPQTAVHYVASAPGESPARVTGNLAASYGVEMPKPLEARVGTEVEYGLHLERGTSTIAPRPAIVPAFQRARSRIESALKAPIRD